MAADYKKTRSLRVQNPISGRVMRTSGLRWLILSTTSRNETLRLAT
jgi:hypothetical protein